MKFQALLLGIFVSLPLFAQESGDSTYLAARDAFRAGDRAKLAQVAPQLTSHPLVAYVEYWQLVPRLRSTDPVVVTEVESFFDGEHLWSLQRTMFSGLGQNRPCPFRDVIF